MITGRKRLWRSRHGVCAATLAELLLVSKLSRSADRARYARSSVVLSRQSFFQSKYETISPFLIEE